MTAQQSQNEWLTAQNAALMEEVARMYYIIESVRVTQPQLVEVFERSWVLKAEEAEASSNGTNS